jgi:hypothetical protein
VSTLDTIKDICGSVNPRPKESEKTMEEYQYLTANTLEAWRTIVDAIFRGDCEIKCTLTKCTGFCGFEFSTGWARADRVENGREYRWKKPSQDVLLTDPEEISQGTYVGAIDVRVHDDAPWQSSFILTTQQAQNELNIRHSFRVTPGKTLPPKKTKKLIDRTAEELIPLIGYIARKKRDGLYFMITSNQVFDQENMEIAPLGSEDWQPMRKEIEVECE